MKKKFKKFDIWVLSHLNLGENWEKTKKPEQRKFVDFFSFNGRKFWNLE